MLGIDNGLSVSKAVVFDFDGQQKGCFSIKNNNTISNKVICEEKLSSLWERTALVISSAIKNAKIKAEEIKAVGNVGAGNGLYFTDKCFKEIGNAILPMDTRSQSIVDNWKLDGTFDRVFPKITQQLWAGQPGSILKWIKVHKPQTYKSIGNVFFRKDWIKYMLTGEMCTDFSDVSASGLFDNLNKCYDSGILDDYGILDIMKSLNQAHKSNAICGYITKEAAKTTGLAVNTPVAGGMFDVCGCTVGSGVISSNAYIIIAGTWGINAAISSDAVLSDQIVQSTIYADGKNYLNINSGATSTINLEWFLKNLNNDRLIYDYEHYEKIVNSFSADSVQILFAPYIYAPIKNENLNAGFVGVKSSDTKKELLRAVYEGIAMEHRDNIESLKECGFNLPKAVFAGGASNSGTWCRIFSDVLGMDIQTTQINQQGALGAAMCAGIAIGAYKDYEEAAKKMVRIKEVYKFNSENYSIYNEKYKKFLKLSDFLSELYGG